MVLKFSLDFKRFLTQPPQSGAGFIFFSSFSMVGDTWAFVFEMPL